jgi:mono/diheme cytochrome c family protein
MHFVKPFWPVLVAGFSLVLELAGNSSYAQTPQSPEQGTKPAANINVERLFATSCGWCHQGGGRAEGRGPKLAGTDKSDEFIISRIKNGKSPGMPAFGRSFNDDQIQAIVDYIRGLQASP